MAFAFIVIADGKIWLISPVYKHGSVESLRLRSKRGWEAVDRHRYLGPNISCSLGQNLIHTSARRIRRMRFSLCLWASLCTMFTRKLVDSLGSEPQNMRFLYNFSSETFSSSSEDQDIVEPWTLHVQLEGSTIWTIFGSQFTHVIDQLELQTYRMWSWTHDY